MSAPGLPLSEQEQLEQRIEAVCRLAAGVAHDFNNLLTVISGNVELLRADDRAHGVRRAELEEIGQAASRAATVTHQLLAFSRQQLLQPRILDLNALIHGYREAVQHAAGLRVAVEMRLEPSLGPVRADASQIQEVLQHLVSNAREAMPAGGTLRIATSNVAFDAERAARHAPMSPGHYVLLSIGDTGVGMDQETLDRAFEPFFTTKQARQGVGMGLPTAYGIIKQSGGFIFADSARGHGTVMRVYLPCATTPEPARPAPRSAALPQRPVGPDTVLVVEDESLVRTLALRALERAGYRVFEAPNAAEGLTVARALGPALSVLLSDIVMPGMDGRELAATIEREMPHVAIVLMSGYAGERDLAEISASSWAFIRKPFTVDELRTRVRDALREQVAAGV
jgi:CheY-like chemotaxis protein